MAMKSCRRCGHEMSTRTGICPGCGGKSSRGHWGKATLALAALLVVMVATVDDEPRAALRPAQVEVTITRAAVVLEARGAAALPAGLEVFVNGPPYGATPRARAAGFIVKSGRAEIPLREFIARDGRRFDGSTHAVVEVWVGGGGYDYAKFGAAR